MEAAMNMEEKEQKASLPFFGIPRLIPYIRKYRKTLLIMIICGLGGTGVDLVLPLLQRYALNHYVAFRTLDTLPFYIVLYVAIILFGAVVNYIATLDAWSTEVRVNRDLRSSAFDHLQKLSFSYYNQNAVGYIHSRVMSDTGRIGSLISWTLMDSVWHLSYLVGSIVIMLVINARLAGMVLLILPLLVLLFSLFQGKLIRANRQIRELNSRITGDFNEGITGAKTIKTLVIEEKMEDGPGFPLCHRRNAAEGRPRGPAAGALCPDHEPRLLAGAGHRALERRVHRRERGRNLLHVHDLCSGDDGARPLDCGRHLRCHHHSGEHRAPDPAAGHGAGCKGYAGSN